MQQGQGAPKPSNFVGQYDPAAIDNFIRQMNTGQSASNIDLSSATNLANTGVAATGESFGRLRDFAPTSTTGNILSDASAFSRNPETDGMIAAALRDPYRDLTENALPASMRRAAGTGNVNSNKTAIRDAVLQRGFEDRASDVSADIRGKLYQSGLDLSQKNLSGNDALTLDSIKTGVQGGINATTAGTGALNNNINAMKGLYDIANTGAAGMQDAQQKGYDEQMAQYQFGANSPFDALNNYWNIIGSGNWGGSSTGQSTKTATSSPSMMGTIGQLGGMAASFLPGGNLFSGGMNLYNMFNQPKFGSSSSGAIY